MKKSILAILFIGLFAFLACNTAKKEEATEETVPTEQPVMEEVPADTVAADTAAVQ